MQVNVVFGADKIFIEHLAVAICSLFQCNPDLSFNVYVLNTDIDKDSWRRLSELAEQYGQSLIDMKILDREVEGLISSESYYTKATYYRLFIPEKLNVDKALYLDSDIVVNGSIEDLYNTNIDQCYLAAVADGVPNPHKDLGMSEGSKYFNCGVMLVNLRKWREDRIKERVIDLTRSKPWAMRCADQCGINSIVNGRGKELHPKYNAQAVFFQLRFEHTRSDLYPAGQLREAVEKPVIIHYSGKEKPWHLGYKHRFRGLYWKYLRETPFNTHSRAERRFANLVVLCVRKLNKEVTKRMLHRP
jgi:lipopolysaccharide biosynthesis glycosyltransferase